MQYDAGRVDDARERSAPRALDARFDLLCIPLRRNRNADGGGADFVLNQPEHFDNALARLTFENVCERSARQQPLYRRNRAACIGHVSGEL